MDYLQKTSNSTIRNFNLISGSINGTTDNVGAVVGNANNTVIENVKKHYQCNRNE